MRRLIVLLLVSAALAVIPLAISWNTAPNPCGSEKYCNQGINPSISYGYPLSLRNVPMFTETTISYKNVAITYFGALAVILVPLLIVSQLVRPKRSKQ